MTSERVDEVGERGRGERTGTRRGSHVLRSLIQKASNGLTRLGIYEEHLDPRTVAILRAVRHATMTSTTKLDALVRAVAYVVRNGIEGDFVECGVWKGGSSMAVALKLLELGVTDRDLWLFDVFTGLPKPGERDVDVHGERAIDEWHRRDRGDVVDWCHGPLEVVQRNMASTGYDPERVHLVAGDVLETIPERAPERIALARLDTDWYDSTYHELVHLWPRLAVGGVLVVDDYDFWQGATEATDRFIAENGLRLFLHPLGTCGVMAVKQG